MGASGVYNQVRKCSLLVKQQRTGIPSELHVRSGFCPQNVWNQRAGVTDSLGSNPIYIYYPDLSNTDYLADGRASKTMKSTISN